MSNDCFTDVRAKLDRAAEFIAEFASLEAACEGVTIEGRIEVINGVPQLRISWDGIGQRPSAIFGDAVHAMRASLDLLATAIVRRAGQDAAKVYFPFAASEVGLEVEIRNKRIDRAGSAAADLVRKHRPYSGGNELLRALHDFDIRDKHIELVPLGTTRRLQGTARYDIGDPSSGKCAIRLKEFAFAIPVGSVLDGHKALNVVRAMHALVVEILEDFEALAANLPPVVGS